MDPEQDGDVLVEVNDQVRASLIRDMTQEELIAAVDELDLAGGKPDHCIDGSWRTVPVAAGFLRLGLYSSLAKGLRLGFSRHVIA